MNRQTNEVLTLLLNTPGQAFTYEILAERLGVSTRTIRNYVQSIEDFLRRQKKEDLLSVSRLGISIDGTQQEIEILRNAVVDQEFYLYCLSPDERCGMIVLELLMSDDYCTAGQFSEKFKVSRGTVLKDMEHVREMLGHQGITLFPMTNKGYMLDIRESERRRLILRNVQGVCDSVSVMRGQTGIYYQYLLDKYELEKYLGAITDYLLEMEKEYHLNVSDARFEEIKLTMGVMFRRIIHQHPILEQHFDVPFIREFVVFEIAQKLLEHFSEVFNFTYTEQEIRFLADALYACRFYSYQTMEDVKDMQLHISVTGFLIQIGKELGIPLYKNQQIVEQLKNHVKSIEKAYWEGEHFQSEFREAVKTEYPQYYQTVKSNIHLLENGLSFCFTDDEMTFVLFYIIAAAEQYFQFNQKPSIIVVCHFGIGTANFLAGQLKNNFNLKIMAVTSRHKLEEVLKHCDYDLIVSTIALNMDEKVWISVSPLLEVNDILALQKRLIEIRNRKRQSRIQKRIDMGGGIEGSVLSGALQNCVLKKENIRLDVECADWKEAIRAAAALLVADHSAETFYGEKMIESVLKYGPYFVYCPGVALAHASPQDGVLRFGISLIRLKMPVCFGHKTNDPVSYVLCLAGRQEDVRMQDVLSIMNVLSMPEELQILDTITDPEELLEMIKKKRMEERYEEQ